MAFIPHMSYADSAAQRRHLNMNSNTGQCHRKDDVTVIICLASFSLHSSVANSRTDQTTTHR